MDPLRSIDALCIHCDLDVLDVLDAASEMPERHADNKELRIYSRLAFVQDVGWITEELVWGVISEFLDYREIDTME